MFFRPLRQFSLLTTALLGLASIAAIPGAAVAQVRQPPPVGGDLPEGYTGPVLQKAREGTGIDEKLDQRLPLDLTFVDSDGRPVRLGDYFKGQRPVVIQMAYYRCPRLCGEISKAMIRTTSSLSEELTIGEDFEVLTISFDSREKPALAAGNKEATVEVLDGHWPAQNVRDGWAYLTGEDENIRRLTDAMGYRFTWVEEAQQYSHPAVLVLCTPDGRISRYLDGLNSDPQTLRLSLINASEGTISPGLKDAFLLSCFEYDPEIGRYTPTAYFIMRTAGVATVLALAGLIGFLLLAERRGKTWRLASRGTPAPDDNDGDDPEDHPPPPRTAFSGS